MRFARAFLWLSIAMVGVAGAAPGGSDVYDQYDQYVPIQQATTASPWTSHAIATDRVHGVTHIPGEEGLYRWVVPDLSGKCRKLNWDFSDASEEFECSTNFDGGGVRDIAADSAYFYVTVGGANHDDTMFVERYLHDGTYVDVLVDNDALMDAGFCCGAFGITGIAVDNAGRLYVAGGPVFESNNVAVFDKHTGAHLATWPHPPLCPYGIAWTESFLHEGITCDHPDGCVIVSQYGSNLEFDCQSGPGPLHVFSPDGDTHYGELPPPSFASRQAGLDVGHTDLAGDSHYRVLWLGRFASDRVHQLIVSGSFCGDGIGDPGEECDDGNNEDGDGCASDCTTEGLKDKFLSSDGAPGHRFGSQVALEGDTAVVTDAGSAYVFVWNGVRWSEQAKLNGSDASASDGFGSSVAVSGDTAVVGAYRNDYYPTPGVNFYIEEAGSAHVFVRSGANWYEQAKLIASDAAYNDWFGLSVALSGDTIVVGARLSDLTCPQCADGSAYVFVRTGTNWPQQAKLTASDAASADFFGDSVAISGNTAVMGAPGDDHESETETGSAYVFVRSGTSWSNQAKLTASDASAGDHFGDEVAVSGDTIIVGAWLDDHGSKTDAGSAYVFVRSEANWSEQAKLTASDAASSDWFGKTVALDGDTAIIGAQEDDDKGESSGSAYVFTRTGDVWTEQAKLLPADGAPGDDFGNSVALDGDIALIGAHLDDDNGEDSGSAYVFPLVPAVPAHSPPWLVALMAALLAVLIALNRARHLGQRSRIRRQRSIADRTRRNRSPTSNGF